MQPNVANTTILNHGQHISHIPLKQVSVFLPFQQKVFPRETRCVQESSTPMPGITKNVIIVIVTAHTSTSAAHKILCVMLQHKHAQFE